MKLIAVTGMNYAAKAQIARELAARLSEHAAVTILDNTEQALKLPYPTVRLPNGCACCSVAYALLDALRLVNTEYAILAAPASAIPEALANVLGNVNSPTLHTLTIALIDSSTIERSAYYAEQLALHADIVLRDAADLAAALPAVRSASSS